MLTLLKYLWAAVEAFLSMQSSVFQRNVDIYYCFPKKLCIPWWSGAVFPCACVPPLLPACIKSVRMWLIPVLRPYSYSLSLKWLVSELLPPICPLLGAVVKHQLLIMYSHTANLPCTLLTPILFPFPLPLSLLTTYHLHLSLSLSVLLFHSNKLCPAFLKSAFSSLFLLLQVHI